MLSGPSLRIAGVILGICIGLYVTNRNLSSTEQPGVARLIVQPKNTGFEVTPTFRTPNQAIAKVELEKQILKEARSDTNTGGFTVPQHVLKERWGVVQVWDLNQKSYPSLILSTNKALRRLGTLGKHTDSPWGPLPEVEHVVIMKYSLQHNKSNSLAMSLMMGLGIKFVDVQDIATYESVAAIAKVKYFGVLSNSFDRPMEFGRFNAKLFLWNFTEYDRLLYLDADVLPVRSLLYLFVDAATRPPREECPAPVFMAADVASGYCYNSGVTLLHPNTAQFQAMMRDLGRTEPKDSPYLNRSACSKSGGKVQGDQDFIQAHFQTLHCIQPIDPTYNVMVIGSRDSFQSTKYEDQVMFNANFFVNGHVNWLLRSIRQRRLVFVFHFGWPKPEMVHWREEKGFFKSKSLENNLSESQRAYASLFKTVWTQYSEAVNDSCAEILKLEDGGMFPISPIMAQPDSYVYKSIQSGVKQIQGGVVKEWCNNPPSYGRFLMDTESVQLAGLQNDERIPLWYDIV